MSVLSEDVQKERIERLYGKFDPSILEHPSETELLKINIPMTNVVDASAPVEEMMEEVTAIVRGY